MTFLLKSKNKKATRILEDIASLDIIEISEETKQSSSDKTISKTLTYFASEPSISKTWDNRTEDKAWKDL